MPMFEIKSDPSVRELRIFALLWIGFFALLAGLCLQTERVVLGLAISTSTLFLISILGNRDFPLRQQLWGVLIPGFLWTVVLTEHSLGSAVREAAVWHQFDPGHPKWRVALVLAGIGLVGAVLILFNLALARVLYRSWMFAALPIGWTFSYLLLAIVYFGVLTPTGLLRRLAGKDSMTRQLDAKASSYWIEYQAPADARRYFRQF